MSDSGRITDPKVLDPEEVARPFRDEVARRIRDEGLRLKLVGVIAAQAPRPCRTYARYMRSACEEVGIEFELREVPRLELEAEVRRANDDPSVHGIMIYYPVFGLGRDHYLKEIVAESKDLEGLGAGYSYNLYSDVRFIDDERTKKSIIPCTPLAIVKILEHVGAYERAVKKGESRRKRAIPELPLAGKKAVVVNRSEVVGRPLAAMLSHDGASVHSIDIDGCLLMRPGERVVECDETLEESLRGADVVVTGVPDPDWRLPVEPLEPGCVVVNFSSHDIVPPEVTDKARVLVRGPGRVTVAMALRNLLRLYDNFHAPKSSRVPKEGSDGSP